MVQHYFVMVGCTKLSYSLIYLNLGHVTSIELRYAQGYISAWSLMCPVAVQISIPKCIGIVTVLSTMCCVRTLRTLLLALSWWCTLQYLKWSGL